MKSAVIPKIFSDDMIKTMRDSSFNNLTIEAAFTLGAMRAFAFLNSTNTVSFEDKRINSSANFKSESEPEIEPKTEDRVLH